MALSDTTWYTNSAGYAVVPVRPQNTAVAAGVLRRQFTTPAVGSERVFVCIVAGTTANVTDATWVLTRGAKTTDGTVTWMECTGQAALNGDLTNTATWAQVKAVTPAVLGQIIKRSNNASYQICTTAGAMSASEPAFSDTAGVTTTDTTAVWTSLGPVSNFTGGQAPHARLPNVIGASGWFASGNTIYVGDNHAETQSTGILMNATSALLARVICHDHAGSYPPTAVMAGATVTTTGNVALQLSTIGSWYFYGITFSAGTGAISSGVEITVGATGQNQYYFDNCSIQIGGTGTVQMQFGNANAAACTIITLNNTTLKFGSTAQTAFFLFTQFTWQNTTPALASGSSIPATLFTSSGSAGNFYTVMLEALDLNQITGTLFSNAPVPVSIGSVTVKDCKLNAATTLATPIASGMAVQLNRCDSAATAYKSARYAYEGTETTETSITRVGGAVDPNGQAQTRKIVTTANTQWLRPFQAEPYAVWNTTAGANVTVTVYGTINAGAVPNNDDIWIEVEYLGSAATPIGTIVTTTKASLLAANAAVASDGSSWNGGGSGAGWSPFKLTTTLSSPQPGLTGYIDVRVRAAKASTTFYVDPKIELT